MCEKVFSLIQSTPGLCDREYAELSGLTINQVTGRRNDLFNRNCVVKSSKKKDPKTGREVLTWRVPEKILFAKKQNRTKCKHCEGKGYVINLLPKLILEL
jgi:hypothetical protein